jgi:hypothetical protein
MKVNVKSLEIQIVLSSPLKCSYSSILDVIADMDAQIEDTVLEEVGYSSSTSLLNPLGRKNYSEEMNLKTIQIHYNLGEEITINTTELSSILHNMMVQREDTELDVDLASFLVTAKNEKEIVSWEKELLD